MQQKGYGWCHSCLKGGEGLAGVIQNYNYRGGQEFCAYAWASIAVASLISSWH